METVARIGLGACLIVVVFLVLIHRAEYETHMETCKASNDECKLMWENRNV